MSVDSFDEADDAEREALAVIARVTNVPIETVAAMSYAIACLGRPRAVSPEYDSLGKGTTLSAQRREAIEDSVGREHRRMIVRRCMQEKWDLWVRIDALVATTQTDAVCNGCPVSILCVSQRLRSPQKCSREGPPYEAYDHRGKWVFRNRGPWVRTTVLDIQGDVLRVDCPHPRGRYTVDVMDVQP